MSDTITVVTTIAMQGVLNELEPQVRQKTGKGIAMVFGPPSKAVELVLGGEKADVVMTTPEGVAQLAAAGKVPAANGRVVAKMMMGVGIRQGAPKPDISTAEKFKQAILAAKSLIHADPASGSPSAAHFIKVARELGIADAIKAKTITLSGLVATAVADGRAELAIQQLSEILLVDGVEAAGPFPAELQNIVPLSASVLTNSPSSKEAAALIEILASEPARKIREKSGMQAA